MIGLESKGLHYFDQCLMTVMWYSLEDAPTYPASWGNECSSPRLAAVASVPHPGEAAPRVPPASSCRPAQARDTAPRLTAAAFPALNIVSILLEAGLGPLASGTLDASPRTAQQGQQASVQVRGKETQAFIFPIVKNLRISIIRKYFLTQDAYFKAPSFCRMVSK